MSLFTDHPDEHGLTYWEHMKFALWGGAKMTCAGLCCIVHAFFPFLFQWTASETAYTIVTELEKRELDSLDNM